MIQVRKSFLYTLLIFIAFLSVSCNEADEVGLGVQPGSDQPGVFTKEVSDLITYTVLEDSLISSSKLSPFFLGSLNDPETGKTHASFFTQVRLGSSITSTTFSPTTTLNSVVFTLGLMRDGIYGDPRAKHHISVYQLNQALSNDSVYYSVDSFAVGNQIGHLDIVPNVSSLIDIDIAQLKIPLDTSFGNKLIYDLKTKMPNNDTLLASILKGIYVVDSVDGLGSIINIAPASSLNKMTLYYNDTSKFSLEINDASARSLHFRHEYCNPVSSVTPQLQLCNPLNPVMNHDTVYVQSLAGLKTKVKLPDWNVVFDHHKVSINRADLVVKVKDGSDAGAFKPHDNLLLLASDSLGKNSITFDFLDIGGLYDATNKEYKLNLTRHLQRILNGTVKDYGLYVIAGGSASNARRTVLNGGLAMKIIITYTQQNN